MPSPAAASIRAPTGEPATRPVTVVTGGSEGIGLAIAGRFAARGQSLVLVARRPESLEAAAELLRQRWDVEVTTLSLDLTAPNALDALDAHLAALGAHTEILVNNAGVGHAGEFAGIDPEHHDRLIALNVAVPGRLLRHVLPGMRQRGRGGILNVASLGGCVPGPYQAVYYASKAYLISLSEAVAAEVRASGVRVTVVVPGPVNTLFHRRMYAESAYYRRFLPAASADSVAGWAVRGFELGVRVVTPGILTFMAFTALRIVPHRLLIPVMAALLQPRGSSGGRTAGDA